MENIGAGLKVVRVSSGRQTGATLVGPPDRGDVRMPDAMGVIAGGYSVPESVLAGTS